MNINLNGLTEEEIAIMFFNDVMKDFIYTIGVRGIVEQLCNFCEGESGEFIEPSIAKTKEEQESWKRDFKKLAKLYLEN